MTAPKHYNPLRTGCPGKGRASIRDLGFIMGHVGITVKCNDALKPFVCTDDITGRSNYTVHRDGKQIAGPFLDRGQAIVEAVRWFVIRAKLPPDAV